MCIAIEYFDQKQNSGQKKQFLFSDVCFLHFFAPRPFYLEFELEREKKLRGKIPGRVGPKA